MECFGYVLQPVANVNRHERVAGSFGFGVPRLFIVDESGRFYLLK